MFLTIKDQCASLSAVCWNFTNRFNIDVTNGKKIILKGYIDINKNSNIQIIINNFQQIDDMGDIYKEYIKLKEYFENKGYFNDNHKKKLPQYIKSIGIATALDGAALQDILYVLRNKGFVGTVHIKACSVQGTKCELSIKQGIEFLDNLNLDVIIVTRGGGSYEDLYGFSKKKVIEAIYNAKTCIISAVGHEVDSMLSDFVADIRAPTPSIAAEIIISNQQSNSKINKYRDYLKELHREIKSRIYTIYDQLEKVKGKLVDPHKKVEDRMMIYKDYLGKLKWAIFEKVKLYRNLFNKFDLLENKVELIGKKGDNCIKLYNGTINILSIKQLFKLKEKYGDKKLKLKLIDGIAEINLSNINIK